MSVNLGAGCLLTNSEGEYLLIQEAKEHVKGKWNLPSGGFSKAEEDHEETIREAAVRETREETGLEVEVEGLIGIYVREAERTDKKNVNIFFEASEIGGELGEVEEGEIIDAKYFSREELKNLELRFDLVKVIDDFERYGSQKANIRELDF
ncbi:MAG: NUDIX hydrolase [Candidatus Nanohaloarchaea archaeon]